MAKRNVDFENRDFQNRWEAEYLFVDIGGKPLCLVCGTNVVVIKEYNIRRHYETKHQDKYKNLDIQQKLEKAEEFKKSLVLQQAMFTKAKSQSEAAVKASFVVAEEIAKSARPFTEGKFLKHCMIKVCDVLCPDKKQAFSNISLSKNTLADRICELATDLQAQLIEKGKYFIAYSLAVNESTDTTDTAQLAIFIRGVDSSLCVTEELLGIIPMHDTTTGKDIFEKVSKCMNDMKLPWDKLTGLTTDGAPATCWEKSGLVGWMQEKMQRENCTGELTVYHCIIHQEMLCSKVLKMEHVISTITQTVNFIRGKDLNHWQFQSFLEKIHSEFGDMPYHTEVRWRSREKVLSRFFELYEEICQFMECKGKDSTGLQNEKWLCELAFLCDITKHLNALNLQLQGRDRVITDMYDAVKAFQVKLHLWEMQMQKGNLCHFRCCQKITDQVSTAMFPAFFADKLNTLRTEFTRRFANFEAQKCNFDLLRSPFAVDVEKAPANIQMELIELQCNGTFRAKYDSVGSAQFPQFIPDMMPQLHLHGARMLCMFGSTYLREQLYSVIKMNKTTQRSHLTDAHLHSILRVSTAQSLTPNINELAAKKRCQASGSEK
ncbi:general transcription factor II-I repeat domain-containing protein 2-like [Neoarius graeffei]|uniref:general transcription factor II-I repeat domain-containing protein 2-like n=1 Tax=Neoarius graeffei TaxID=443677 RepID=UPI00298BD7BA|nr:general transcription factor II-I repeat domain-containing protein 2-like [Neoarius graeffei]